MSVFNGWRLTRTGILFVIGIVVLTGLVFAGIMFVRERGEQARRQEAVKIAEQNLESQSDPATNPVAVEGEASAPGQVTETDEATTMVASTQTTEQLPQTGPELYSIVIVTLLAMTGAFYATSRRAVREL